MAFGMINWNQLAQRKYDIAQQGADADTSRARTARMGAEAAAALTPAQIAQAEASAAVERARAAGMPGLMDAQVQQALGAASTNFATADSTNLQTRALASLGAREFFDARTLLDGGTIGDDSPLFSANFKPPAPQFGGLTSSRAQMTQSAGTGAFGQGGARRVQVERRPRVAPTQTTRGMAF